jgi:hypothetical protein
MAYFSQGQLQKTQLVPRAPNLSPEMCPPIGGYNLLRDSEMGSIEIGKTLQLFSSQPVTSPLNPTAALYFNPNTKLVEMCSSMLTTKGERLWLVMANAVELIRISPVEGGSISRVSKDTILSPTTPRYSALQAMCTWMDGSAISHLIKFDIGGGTTFKVFGRNVQMYILCPEDTQIINSPQTPDIPLSGITLNDVVSAKIAPLTVAPANLDILKFTWNQGVTANTQQFVEIPPGARKVRIINASTGITTSLMYFWLTNDITQGHSMGIIDFVTSTPNETNLVEIPVGATHIMTGPVNAMADRCFSFVFTIDP